MSDKLGQRLVWVFAVVGVLGVLAVIFLAVMVAGLGRSERADPAPIDAKAPGDRFAVAETNTLPGINLIEIVIATEKSIDRNRSSYSSGGPTDERNVILLDKASGANRRLLPDNQRSITYRRYLPARVDAQEQASGEYQLVEADGKQRPADVAYYAIGIRSADGKSEDVLLGNLASGRQAMVLKNIDGVDRIWMQSPTRVAFLLRSGRKLMFRAFEAPDLRLVASQPIEID